MKGSRDFAHEKNTRAPEGAVAGVGAEVKIPGRMPIHLHGRTPRHAAIDGHRCTLVHHHG
jgi:hypothetical protein